MLTIEMMNRRWPHADQHVPGLSEGIVATAPAVFSKYGLNSPLVQAHFMAQASEECGQGLEMVENGNYSAQGLLNTFPTHFTPTMAARAAHNPRLVFDVAYGGRMGNLPPPSDDGYNNRGRGLSQVTGEDGYAKLDAFLKAHGVDLDLLHNPDAVIDPEHTLECGVADFIVCGCLPFAEADNVLMVTKRLNGGTNGLTERKRQLVLWKQDLLADTTTDTFDAAWLQTQLNRLGASPPLVVDGADGPATREAVKAFQAQHNLTVDGVVRPDTIAAIQGAA
jgi:putative chitinase